MRPSIHALTLTCLGLAACAQSGPAAKPSPATRPGGLAQEIRERAGLVFADDAYGDSATRLVYLDQGWGSTETQWFYHADQGSVLMPYSALLHLEQASGEELFIAPENLTRYRLLTQTRSPWNPDALPVGFARHGDQVGLTCAACHTTQINYRGTAMRIDGAPALADIDGLLHDIDAALAATLADEAKLARHAARAGTELEATRASLASAHAWFESYLSVNRSTTREGFGRLDAIGRILNQAIRFTSGPENSVEPNAPTSFPLLWDTPRHDYVQWTGFSSNAEAGSLGRNVGEVVGVFGHVQVQRYDDERDSRSGYESTVEGRALVRMEETLRKLESPVWPAELLPPIDQELAERGAELYAAQCASCHALIDRDDRGRQVTAMVMAVDDVGTDATSANNLVHARVPAGVLEGALSLDGRRYGATLTGMELLGDLVGRILVGQPLAAAEAIANAKRHGIEASEKQGSYPRATDDPTVEYLAYKARPLNGVWATSPYLHNGSVPTLYDLLLPPAQRPARFAVGRWEFDPVRVGYVSDGDAPFVLDTSLTGNANGGHEYGTALADDDRWALVEYLKTL